MNIGMTASRQFKFNLYFLKLQGSHSWAFGPPINDEKFDRAGVSPAV
jgi:hypothetical protein